MKRELILEISLLFCAYFAPHCVVRRFFRLKLENLPPVSGLSVYFVYCGEKTRFSLSMR